MNLLGKRFRIEDSLLGFGSFGRTYLGKDIKRNRDVAIKIVILYYHNLITDAKKEVYGFIFKRSNSVKMR